MFTFRWLSSGRTMSLLLVRRWKLFRDVVLQQPNGREVLFNGRPPLQENWVSDQVPRASLVT